MTEREAWELFPGGECDHVNADGVCLLCAAEQLLAELARAHAEGKADGRREMAEEIDRLRLYRTDLADELIWIRRGGPMPLAHNHEIEGPGMYVRNAPCPRCDQIKATLTPPEGHPRAAEVKNEG